MPHVVIQCFKDEIPAPNRERIGQAIASLLHCELACDPGAVSVDLQPVEPQAWREQVFEPLIAPRMHALIRKPAYSY